MLNFNQDSGFILIVDDNPTNLAVLGQTLKSAGFSIRVEMDGKGVLELVEEDEEHPELILLDVEMPEIDGFETCRRLKANKRTQNIPVIFMTALADTENKVKGLSLGAVDYITKPFEEEEVLARVRVHLQVRQLTKKLEQWNEQLEERVTERTNQLQQAQVQLVQQEKFASIGQLIAGVAHEINNPIGCIVSNIIPAFEYVTNLTEIIRLYQQKYPNPEIDIQEALRESDIDFALEDFPKILDSIQLSAVRIKDISVSLRNFSRGETSSKISANIHQGLDSTLLILQHRLKSVGNRPAIQVIKEYGDLLEVKCYPGLLNQVFMNLLANGIDALENVSNPTITISTTIQTETVEIRIADNGMGMSPEIQQKLFQPLFTTKSLGKGTGLGLSIAKQILEEKHSGKLSFESEVGKGTVFILNLPI